MLFHIYMYMYVHYHEMLAFIIMLIYVKKKYTVLYEYLYENHVFKLAVTFPHI